MGDAEDERAAIDARLRTFTEGLVALQLAVTQVTNTVGEFVRVTGSTTLRIYMIEKTFSSKRGVVSWQRVCVLEFAP